MGVVESWNRLIDLWRELGHPIVDRLQPGLSREEILTITEPIGYTPHEDCIAFYQCCNGSDPYRDPQDEGHFFHIYWIPELREVVTQIKELDDLEDYMPAWKFFPFLQEDAYFYGVRSVPEEDGSYPVYNWPETADPHPVFDSLTAMLDTMYQWYADGVVAFGMDEYGYQSYFKVTDNLRYATTAASRNPNRDYWRRALQRHEEGLVW